MQENLWEMAAAGTHDAALRLLPKGMPPTARIGDMPCGAGALTQRLIKLGYSNIVCADIDLSQLRLGSEVKTLKINLSAPVESNHNEFDCIYCIECIEHVENPFQLMRNCANLLKLGGSLIVSTPNILSTTARTKYLIGGYFPHFYELAARWEEVIAAKYQAHINPLPLQALMFMAWKNGLTLQTIDTNRLVHRQRLKDRLVAFVTKRFGNRLYSPEMASLLYSEPVLFGDILVVKFSKCQESLDGYAATKAGSIVGETWK